MTAIYPRSKKVETYEGWANRSTWNVALWINNDYNLYNAACSFMQFNPDPKNPYKAFIWSQNLIGERTPDGISYWSTRLNYKELNDMMRDLA
jgi:hypothetical protein